MNILENSKVVFLSFIAFGFLFPWYADDLQVLLLPLLILMMTISIKDVHIGHINKHNHKRVLQLIGINFFILSPLMILLAVLFVDNVEYVKGIIVLAAMPPAASIIPLIYIYHGDIKDSVLGEVACYTFSLLFAPAIALIFFSKTIDVFFFIRILMLLIFLPMILGKLIHNKKWKIFNYKHEFVNLVYGFSFYIFIGLNRDAIISDIPSLLPMLFIFIFLTFALSWIIFLTLKLKKIKKKQDIMFVLFGTFKNGNAGATLAIILFGPAAAIPMAVRGIVIPFYFMFLERLFKVHSSSV